VFHDKREQTVSQVPSGGLGFGASMLEITSLRSRRMSSEKALPTSSWEGRAATRQKNGRPTKYLKEG